ncbi:hypothetical protein E4T47_07778 [Aureobasidium subglaciale]|nr:hypothetical protein E4T47_07778 [Aureobasidium subglaciale]
MANMDQYKALFNVCSGIPALQMIISITCYQNGMMIHRGGLPLSDCQDSLERYKPPNFAVLVTYFERMPGLFGYRSKSDLLWRQSNGQLGRMTSDHSFLAAVLDALYAGRNIVELIFVEGLDVSGVPEDFSAGASADAGI